MNFSAIREWLENFEWAIAGLFGGLAGLHSHREQLQTKTDMVIFVATGAVCAHFLTGIIANRLDIERDTAGSVGFLLGVFGASLLAAIATAIKKADIMAILKNKFPSIFGGPAE